MNKIKVENYRSIVDSGEIDICPITIAVGRNSVGKSSFIRVFPLLKQTIEKKTEEPLLWYGDYVDFGDFQHTVSKFNSNNPIKISFEINAVPYRYARVIGSSEEILPVKIELSIVEKYFDKITISFYDQMIEICIDENNKAEIYINSDKSVITEKEILAITDIGDIIPNLYQKLNDDENGWTPLSSQNLIKKVDNYVLNIKLKIEKNWFPYFDYTGINVGAKESILNQFKKVNKERFESKKITDKRFLKYNNYVLAISLPTLIGRINQTVKNCLQETSYIKPIRAYVNRYYRVQGVSINEIDADGSNLPMILKNMSDKQLREFERWSKEKFNIVFSVSESEGHVSLVIKKDLDSKEYTNVADTGYGYSQMLPIVVLLWMIHEKNYYLKRRISKTIVIEQPELHLHPAYQAKMMDVFVNIVSEARNKQIDLKIIFETHSEAMINRLGLLIAYGKFKKEDVNILFFENKNGVTCIDSKKYDDNGLLTGWPIDFFAPEDIE